MPSRIRPNKPSKFAATHRLRGASRRPAVQEFHSPSRETAVGFFYDRSHKQSGAPLAWIAALPSLRLSLIVCAACYARMRIRELIALETWPNGWKGTEPNADVWLDQVNNDGSVQPVLLVAVTV